MRGNPLIVVILVASGLLFIGLWINQIIQLPSVFDRGSDPTRFSVMGLILIGVGFAYWRFGKSSTNPD